MWKIIIFVLQRNSLELDSSLGILSPEEMKDFTLNSMTQSFASITSLPRDVSCEDLDSAADRTVTEEYEVEVMLSAVFWLFHQTNVMNQPLFTFRLRNHLESSLREDSAWIPQSYKK